LVNTIKIFAATLAVIATIGVTSQSVYAPQQLRNTRSPHIAQSTHVSQITRATQPALLQPTGVAIHNARQPKLSAQGSGLRLIAHAGGSVQGYTNSNSLEALEHSAALGFRYIELDMLPTSDGHIALTHDWYHFFNRVPGAGTQAVPHADFMEYRIFGSFTTLDLPGLIRFLDKHEDIRIITDTKASDYAALYAITTDFPDHVHRFIPQAYNFASIPRIRAMGFEDIILTLYMLPFHQKMNPAEITAQALEHNVWAVTMPDALVTDEYIYHLALDRIPHFIHTIDCPNRAAELANMGFAGIYTGFLAYDTTSGRLVSHFDGLYGQIYEATQHIGNLSADARRFTAHSILYHIGSPIYVHAGRVAAVKPDGVAAPFQHPRTGEIYIPAHHFYRYTTSYSWDRGEMALTLLIPGRSEPVILRGKEGELLLYRDMIFVSAQTAADIFRYRVLRHNEGIALTRGNTTMRTDILSEIFSAIDLMNR